MRLEDLAPAGIAFVVAGIVIGVGADVLTDGRDAACSNTTATVGETGYCGYDVWNYSIAGEGELASWMPTIALVVAAAIIIGIVVTYFVYKRD